MTPDLTDQQRQALHEANDAGPVTVVDPATNTQYVLVRADVFEEMREWIRGMPIRSSTASWPRMTPAIRRWQPTKTDNRAQRPLPAVGRSDLLAFSTFS